MISLSFLKALYLNQLHGTCLPYGTFHHSCLYAGHLPQELVSSLKTQTVSSVPYTVFPKVLFMEFHIHKSLSRYSLENCLLRKISLLAWPPSPSAGKVSWENEASRFDGCKTCPCAARHEHTETHTSCPRGRPAHKFCPFQSTCRINDNKTKWSPASTSSLLKVCNFSKL